MLNFVFLYQFLVLNPKNRKKHEFKKKSYYNKTFTNIDKKKEKIFKNQI